MKNHTNNTTGTILVPFIFFFYLFSWIFMAMSAQNTSIPVKVGVLLDFDSGNGTSAKVHLTCIKMALADFYVSYPYFKTRLDLQIRNSKDSVIGAAAAALDLINNAEVHAIIGPETSMQASFVVNIGAQAKVPILSFMASSPCISSQRKSYFFRLTQNDSTQMKAISDIIQHFGWRQVVPIYEDNIYGEAIIPFLIDALQSVDAHIPYRSLLPQSANGDQIENELKRLTTMPTRVFIVHMKLELCIKLFAKAKEIGMMSKEYVWILTSWNSNLLKSMRDLVPSSMEGVLGVHTDIPVTPDFSEFERRWRSKFGQDYPNIEVDLDVYGLQAYDASYALAMAIKQVGNRNVEFRKASASFKATDLNTLKVSKYGPKLEKALSLTTFKGKAGDFYGVEGQLQSSNFMIINVNGGVAKPIASWTPEKGMVSKSTRKISTNSKCDLGTIKWPGDSTSTPRGWEIPVKNRKLTIGVPVKVGFREFVNITKDTKTNATTNVTGFCIDVFNHAVKLLEYPLPCEFIPYENSNGLANGTYDELVNQVYLQRFDAVVGDITITASRSFYVDFTMPYTESDVGMVVPIRDSPSKNAWIFLKPLTWSLWLTTFCFLIFTAFVVWLLEHRVNEDFRGPPSHQIGTSFWFSFSTMVFSHREKVVSNLARFVMIVWVFVMLVVTTSYTANLSSLLTVKQLQPTVSELSNLIRNKDTVGYIEDPFVRDVLIRKGFTASNLRAIKCVEDGDKALTSGTANGGIAAVIGGKTALKIFVAKYCSKYTMVGPLFKTNGFGFVFPKRSPLLADISQAILNMTEGGKISSIEAGWIRKESNCQEWSTPDVSGYSLGLSSFWGLFLIVGVVAALALILHVTSFLYKQKHVFIHPDSNDSIWRRIRAVIEIFDDRDVSSHSSKRSDQQRGITSVGNHEVLKASESSNWLESPLSHSNNSFVDSVFFGDQETSSTGRPSAEFVPTAALVIKTHGTPHKIAQ